MNRVFSTSCLMRNLFIGLFVGFYGPLTAANTHWTQTDWSGGSGQNIWSNSTQYGSDDGLIKTSITNQLSIENSINTGTGTIDLIVSLDSTVINEYSAVIGSPSAGSFTIDVSNGSLFQNGSEILIHQTQHADSAGNYEFHTVVSKVGNTLNLDSGLIHTYYSGTDNVTVSSTAQVVSVPHYNSVTINNGVTMESREWDGVTGGIVIFRTKETVTLNGYIDVDGQGFRGGNCGTCGDAAWGTQGEGHTGIGGNSVVANGSGGGGGYGPSGIGGEPGAGGGHAFAGSSPASYGAPSQPIGGVAVGDPQLSKILFGGGAGAGGDNDNGTPFPQYVNGGGIVILFAKTIVDARITSKGEDGVFSSGAGGVTGGGAGGAILLSAKTITTQSVDASGGAATPGSSPDIGGAGSVGRIRIDVETCTGCTTTPTPVENIIAVADSAVLLSSIYAFNNSDYYGPYRINWEFTDNGGSVDVWIRTASTTGSIPGEPWVPVIKNARTDFNTGFSNSDAYVQYKVTLTKGSADSPIFEEINIELGEKQTPLTAPVRLYLGNDVLFTSEDVRSPGDNLSWSQDTTFPSNFLSYELFISPNANYSTILYQGNVGGDTLVSLDTLTLSSALQDNTPYYWAVRSKDVDNVVSTYTSLGNRFIYNSINQPPPIPAIYTNSGIALTATQPLYFKSQDPDSLGNQPDQLTYRIELDTDPAFGSIDVTHTTQDTTPLTGSIAGLVNATNYFWRVWTEDDSSAVSSKTTGTHWFTYIHSNSPPSAISLTLFIDDTEFFGDSLIRWNKSIDPEGNPITYIIEGRHNTFGDTLLYATILSDTALTLNQLIDSNDITTAVSEFNDRDFVIRVKARDSYQLESIVSDWKPVHFNQINDVPSAVTITTPLDSLKLRPPEKIRYSASFHSDQREDIFYEVELGADPHFIASLSKDTVPEDSTSVPLQNLGGHSTLTINNFYYLRVAAFDANGNKASSSPVRTFQYSIDSITPPLPLSLGMDSLFASGNERMKSDTLAWSWSRVYSYGYLEYTLQISSDSLFTTPLISLTNYSDTSVIIQNLPNVTALTENKRYFWRVKEIIPAGAYSEYTDVSNFFVLNTTNDKPLTISSFSPSVSAGEPPFLTSDSLLKFITVDPDTLGITPDKLSYTIQISQNSGFTPVLTTISGVTENEYLLGSIPELQDTQIYYWRVFATDNHGLRSDTTIGTHYFEYSLTNAAPSSVFFKNLPDSAERGGSDLLEWNKSIDPDAHTVSYVIEGVSDTIVFTRELYTIVPDTSLTLDSVLSHNTLSVTDYDDKIYFVRIYSRDQYNARSVPSAWQTLFINLENDIPTAVSLKKPLDDSSAIAESEGIVFSKSKHSDHLESFIYILEIAEDTSFTQLISVDTLSSTEDSLGFYDMNGSLSLEKDIFYHVRVRPIDRAGNAPEWSAPKSFQYITSNGRPGIPELISPIDTVKYFLPRDTLYWGGVTDGDGDAFWYEVYIVNIDEQPTNKTQKSIAFKTGVDTTQLALNALVNYRNLQSHTKYRWIVQAKDIYNAPSGYATEGIFTFRSTRPDDAVIIAPKDSAVANLSNPFYWHPAHDVDLGVDDELLYELLISKSESFDTKDIVLQDTIISDTLVALTDLPSFSNVPDDQWYYWKVYTIDRHGLRSEGGIAEPFFFNLGNQAPTAPVDLTMGDGDSLFYAFEELKWTGSDPDPQDIPYLVYDIQIDDSHTFASPDFIRYGVTGETNVALNTFSGHLRMIPGHRYYWRVIAQDSEGLLSPFSDDSTASFVFMPSDSSLFEIPNVRTINSSVLTSFDTLEWHQPLFDDVSYRARIYSLSGDTLNTIVFKGGVDSISKIALSSLLPDTLYQDEHYYFWDIIAFSNTTQPEYGPLKENLYFYTGNRFKSQNISATRAWLTGPDSTLIQSADSLFTIVIPNNAFTDTVGIVMQTVPKDTSAIIDSTTKALVSLVTYANKALASNRKLFPLGQKVFSVEAHDLATDTVVQPDSTSQLLLHLAYENRDSTDSSVVQFSDSLFSIYNTAVFWLDETKKRWVEQQSVVQPDLTIEQPTILPKKSLTSTSSNKENERAPHNQFNALTYSNHFSVYTIFAVKRSIEPFGDFLIYPSPIITSSENPDKQKARISFSITDKTSINLRIYSRTGKLVWKYDRIEEPVDGLKNEIIWDCKNLDDYLVGNGYYIVKIRAKSEANNKVYIQKQLIAVIK
ncbi:MAG: hypothetical protein OCC49_13910 [Fibrobacterales bacterium]